MTPSDFFIDIDRAAIPLTKGMFAVVSAADWERASALSWFAIQRPHTCYAKATVGDQRIYLHRFIAGLDAIKVDHRDGCGLNNCRGNLRRCTNRQNAQNQRPRVGTSKYKGVVYEASRGKWAARIRDASGKRRSIGRFDTELEAARAYDSKAIEFHGEYAYINIRD